MILALAFVVGIAFAAYAEVQNVKVSGDLTVIGAERQLQINKQNGWQATDRSKFLASITRVRIDADLTDNVMATVRLLNERYWGGDSDNYAYDSNAEVDLSLAYVTLKEFLYSPLTMTIGLQELHFGNDMIVGDPDTNNAANSTTSVFGGTNGNGVGASTAARDPDLSARKSFDAIRATLNYDPLIVDIVASKVEERTLNKDDDVNLYGVNAAYQVNNKTNVQGYWFMKQTQPKDTAVVASTINKQDAIHTLGALVKGEIAENLSMSAEGAVQLGKAARTPNATNGGTIFSDKDVQREAWATELGLNLGLPKVEWTPNITALYAFFSGQKGDVNKRVKAWDPMFENQSYGNLANALFNQTNAHILGAIVSAKPMNDVTLKGEYYAYWWDKVYGDGQSIYTARGESVCMTDKKYAGSELDLTAIYDYTEDVQFSLMGGVLFPGRAFDKGNRNVANEVIGQMKVSF